MPNNFNEKFIADISKNIEIDKYIQLMQEAKNILIEITRLSMTPPENIVLSDKYLVEFLCLQVRKLLEIIALSSLVSNKEVYIKLNQKFDNLWKGRDIIKEIEKHTKHVFPISSYKFQRIEEGKFIECYQNLKPIKQVLNKDKFCEIYEKCCKVLHTFNPYDTTKRPDLQKISEKIPTWIKLISNTIMIHSICPYEFEFKRYFIYMGDPLQSITYHELVVL